ncbi:dimethylsulfone monooxygenase SfnG [Halopenitus sp. POP-27]|uniref:dimethylsulfone monooxygenase SfnG n=1 Tax=Halopenitus sp. POP-27 TaxID=2994425 RepID=UPI002468A30A|nr:dimethyl sulfone monooxygenase SfnG [Halopenitus sp. POP-27]
MDTEFAYWVPNVSGGLVVSDWEMDTDWTYEYNLDLARTAEDVGFEYALAQARFFGSYGADRQLEALSIANALAAQTEDLHVIGAVHPGLWEPGPLANFIATADRISNGRFSINVVSGWFKGEFTGFGQPWLAHDERYARSEEFIEVLKALWTEEYATYDGRFYTIGKDIDGFDGAPMQPKPVQDPYPQVFQGGNSTAARKMAARQADVLFINGGSLETIRGIIEDVESYAEEFGTEPPRFAANGFVIQRDTEAEAKETLEGIIENATDEAVEAFREQVKQAGQSSAEGEGMWDDSDFEDLVQYNDGFKTGLIGTTEQIVERIRKLDAIGIDIVLAGFLHYDTELEQFGEEIIPAVREADPLDPTDVDDVIDEDVESIGGAEVAR